MQNRPPRNPRSTFEDRSAPSWESGSSELSERSETRRLPEIRIAGGPAVEALFRHNPGRVLRFFYSESKARKVGVFCKIMAERRLPYRMVPDAELEKIYGSPHHGGVVAIASPKEEMPLTPKGLSELKKLAPIHFVLDGIGNPHNIGAIARSLAFFGFKSLILSDDPRQAGLSDATYRVAEGGLEALALYRAQDLGALLEEARKEFKITGTAITRDARPLSALTISNTPRLILLGNEEEGLPPQRLKACDELLMIPGAGQIQSLNVAQTAAILGYAFQPSASVSKPTLRLPKDRSAARSGPSQKGETRPRGESGHTPQGRDSKAGPQKKKYSAKGSRPGTKTPSR